MDIINHSEKYGITFSDVIELHGCDCNTISKDILFLLSSYLGDELPTISQISKAMGYSERTLRRKLKKEGTSYRQLRENVRKKSVLNFLQNKEMTLIDISHFLGYKDQSTFNHAFRNWYNESPGQFRKRMTSTSQSIHN